MLRWWAMIQCSTEASGRVRNGSEKKRIEMVYLVDTLGVIRGGRDWRVGCRDTGCRLVAAVLRGLVAINAGKE